MDTENNYYTSLPTGLHLAPSTVAPVGIFANEPFKAGHIFGLARVLINETWVRSGVLGSVVNHSDQPNCRMSHYFWEDNPASDLIAYHDIEPGEELTVFYTLKEYDEAPWIDFSVKPDWA